MRVVSWNVQLGIEVGRAIDALKSNPDLKDVDLLLLQEMDDVGPSEIAEALGLQSVYFAGCTVKGTGKPFGNAILARGRVGEAVTINLPYPGRFLGLRPRIAVQAAVTVEPLGGKGPHELMVWSVHAETATLPHRFQVAQYREIADRIVASSHSGAIVGGDFNTASNRSIRGLVANMERAEMTRLLPPGQTSFSRFRRSFELDHLFGSGFEVVESGLSRDHDASDHDPVWAVVRPIGSRGASHR